MITAYEQTFERENSEATDGATDSVPRLRRQAYYLAVASFICNLVCSRL